MAAQIVVHLSDAEWTMHAMHLACAVARSTQSGVVLLYLMPVANPALLGTSVGLAAPSESEREHLDECAMIAEDYGLEITLQPMQYESFTDALVQAAAHLDATAIFAHLPEGMVPIWKRFQVWNLRRQLAAQRCRLYTLDQPEETGDWVPSVSLKALK